MCGIIGVLGNLSSAIDENVSTKILETLACRGPDNQTFLISDAYSLGHTRLSILGLGEASNQPYSTDDSEWIMTFNGEVYNFKELRKNLIDRGYAFETNSDTEVLFKGFCEYGNSFFEKVRGMFAVAFFNPVTQQLIMGRDYSGEKPLYYMITEDSVVFSSCISAIQECLPRDLLIEDLNIEKFLHYQFVPSHLSVFREVKNLNPGTVLEIMIPSLITTETKINLPRKEEIKDKNLAISQIREAFREAVSRTLVSDVPLALSLSGGLDSVSIAAQIRAIESGMRITAFTAGYEGNFDFDERRIARRVAQDLGLNHIEIEISKKEFIEDFPRLVQTLNSPIADLAAYPQFRIAEAMHVNGFKVGILGIGGDELFWGYNWAIETLEHPKNADSKDLTIKKNHVTLKERLHHARDNFFNAKYSQPRSTPEGYPVFYESLGDFNSPFLLKSEFLNSKIFSGNEAMYEVIARTTKSESAQSQFQSILCDSWLTCNSLSLADSLGMQNSVEYRLPFLDVDLVSLSHSLTRNLYDESKNKNLLREALVDLVPSYVGERAKSGFRFPSNLWLPDLFSEYEFDLTQGQLVNRGFAKVKDLKKLIHGSKRTWAKQFLLYKLLILEFYLQNLSGNKPHG